MSQFLELAFFLHNLWHSIAAFCKSLYGSTCTLLFSTPHSPAQLDNISNSDCHWSNSYLPRCTVAGVWTFNSNTATMLQAKHAADTNLQVFDACISF
mmetsp:Transcript_910/g.1020  ORF Transcript_910/g.1020 Transcript_910/m.1020 type:complete len:97 (-) Transcript_910:214-504(-)